MNPAAVAGLAAGPDLAGSLCLRPGGSLPTISSTRREWAPLLVRGRPAEALPTLLGAVFSLCGGAHQVAAGHAVAAARDQTVGVSPAQRRLLQLDTVREHLRRLWLDAPRLLPDVTPGPDLAALASCPVMAAGAPGGVTAAADLNATRDWVAQHVLGQPVADWLAAWQADPAGFSRHWAGCAQVWPARWLAAAAQRGLGLRQRPVPLQPHASALELRRLAGQLQHEAGFALAPTWRGHTAETGCWTRLADPLAAATASPTSPPSPYTDIVLRLAARVADLAHLVAEGGERWLQQGALPLGPGEGLGWCEMARGLLLHRVQLDGQGRVADFRLVAPTEWNFHPFGTAARALALLPPQAHENRVRLLAAAYDPCVAVQVVRVADEVETPHA